MTELSAEVVFEENYVFVLQQGQAASKRTVEVSGEEEFQTEMRQLFSGRVSGQLTILTLQDALNRIEKLESGLKLSRSIASFLGLLA